ncbi:hypothetical protein NMY22_g14958 [Coprinellus aureogranulatus]|nr:hypothetical protein NMY22_g14958 [Coprinellus aureogranulatus]
MAFNGAHDFGIETAQMASTNSGPVMFWNNTYHTGATHNMAVVTGGGENTPRTIVMSGPTYSRSSRSRRRPPRVQDRRNSDSSMDWSISSEGSSLDEREHRQLPAPRSQRRGIEPRLSDYAPPQQRSPIPQLNPPQATRSPPQAPAVTRHPSERSGPSSHEVAFPQGPPSPRSTGTPSYHPRYSSSPPGGSQTSQQAEAWSQPSYTRSLNPYPQPSPQPCHAESARNRNEYPSSPHPAASDSMSFAGGPLANGEATHPASLSEAAPRGEDTPSSPGSVVRSSSGSSRGADARGHGHPVKKPTFWQRMKFWSKKKNENRIVGR